MVCIFSLFVEFGFEMLGILNWDFRTAIVGFSMQRTEDLTAHVDWRVVARRFPRFDGSKSDDSHERVCSRLLLL